MDTSDDPVTVGIIGAGALGLGSGSDGIAKSIPPIVRTSAGPKATMPDVSKDIRVPPGDRKRRRQQAASVLTRDWLPPTLGTPGLLGIG